MMKSTPKVSFFPTEHTGFCNKIVIVFKNLHCIAKSVRIINLQSQFLRDVAQPCSALRSGRRGRKFESSHPDINQLSDLQLHIFAGLFLLIQYHLYSKKSINLV